MSAIPHAVRRQLRQEAGFGCCVCGHPILQYHHIIPRYIQDHNRPDDMMALCPNHHDAATKGAFVEEAQRKAKARPFNQERGYADGWLTISQDYCAIDSGTFQFVGTGAVFEVDGEELLTLSTDGKTMLLSAMLYDDSDNVLALIDENEWISGDPRVWDLEADHQRLVIRLESRDIRLRVDARRDPVALSATLWRRGARLDLKASGLLLATRGHARRMSIEELCVVNMAVVVDTDTGEVTIRPNPDGEVSGFVSWPDRLERIARAVMFMRGLPAPND